MLTLAGSALFGWGTARGAPGAAGGGAVLQPRHVAVLYEEADETVAGDYAQLIAAIESSPEVVVYRLALQGRTELTATEATPFPPAKAQSRPLMVALNETSGPIGVIYPDIGEPYRSVFAQIIEGIEEKTRTRVASFAVGANASGADIAGELKKNDIRVVIALGRNGLKTAGAMGREVSVVGGGVLSVPEADARGMTVLSLAPDPALLFGRLKSLRPASKRVFTVYDPRQNAWLMRLAQEAATANGLELVAREAEDLKTAMRLYQEILAGLDPARDALWLPQDATTVDEAAVLPFLLQEAWTRGFVVFSSNLAHVKRGALFSLYPNNKGLGRSLALSALGQIAAGGVAPRGMFPLKDVSVAVNVRTAAHLGIATRQSFDMVFPEQ